ncbi:HAD family hydrolase [Parabacteroides sp. FAFU027]|uniref:HAD family hydrolase n=1 Tax=Parabacteroides sp. FAFU027 TaxID=2922715 RepID=UPI001FAFD297|nr:HAD family phosphatase [Parabacteroides sp. FAFU027]
MNQMIKTIIFDLGGVLYDLDRQRCVNALEKAGLDNVNELLTNYKQAGVFQQLEDGEIAAEQFYAEIRQITGKNVPDEAIKNAWDAFLVEIPDYKLEMVLNLRKRFQVFMLSNTNEIHFSDAIPRAFEKNGKTIHDYFDRLYLSYQMNVSKPNPSIFHQLISDSGIDPQETLFIDDSPENVRVASEMGFKTYLAQPKENFSHIFEGLE